MSIFATTIEEISEVLTHPNADTLDIACLKAMPEWKFVVRRGDFKVGDLAVYFQVGSVLPDSIITKMGLTGKLSGAQKNRIKTVELRGQISQGICVKPSDIFTDIAIPNGDVHPGLDVTELLGVTKYEPPVKPCQNGTLVPMPDSIHHYDIQGTERFSNIVEHMLDVPCYITEKVEGSHIAVQRTSDGHLNVCMRNNMIVPDGVHENQYYRGMRLAKVPETLEKFSLLHPGKNVALRGELVGPGVERNIYGLKEFDVYAFELLVEHTPIDKDLFYEFMKTTETKTTYCESYGKTLREYLMYKPNPVDWADGLIPRTIPEASNGYSQINSKVRREGIVIQPIKETRHPTFGRIILKKHSPLYLAKQKQE